MTGSSNSMEDALGQYKTPLPDIVNRYMANLSQGKLLDMPSFDEMFNSYREVANREADRQSGAIREAFGSSGARYGSDLLNAESKNRENTSMDLASKASEYQQGLRTDQFKELSGIANMQYGRDEAAMSRLWSDFLRRTSPSPGLSDLYNLAGVYGAQGTVVG